MHSSLYFEISEAPLNDKGVSSAVSSSSHRGKSWRNSGIELGQHSEYELLERASEKKREWTPEDSYHLSELKLSTTKSSSHRGRLNTFSCRSRLRRPTTHRNFTKAIVIYAAITFMKKHSDHPQSSCNNCDCRGHDSAMSEVVREKVRAAVCCAILDLPEPSLNGVRRRVFPDGDVLNPTVEATLRDAYSSQLYVALLAHCKESIARKLTIDVQALFTVSAGRLDFLAEDPEMERLLLALPLDSPEAIRLHQELLEFQQKLNRRIDQLSDSDAPFREALVDWMRSGEPTCDMWRVLNLWRKDGGRLAAFREYIPLAIPKDAVGSLLKVLDAARELRQAEEFADRAKILRILDQCCTAKFDERDRHLLVEGDVVAISLVIDAICASLSHSSTEESHKVPHTVSIYAADCCSLDCSIDQPEWRGVNLCIVTKRVYVHDGGIIELSGRQFEESPIEPGWDVVNRRARSSDSPQRPGSDGKCGRAGHSSGNLLIHADELVGGERLSVRLHGARGEDGEDGGDGCEGEEGAGVTWEELEAMNFPDKESSPDECTRTTFAYTRNFSRSIKHYEFVDNKGRNVFYSALYAILGNKRMAFIQGTPGKTGSIGGVGGTGGEGGYAGTCLISDHTGRRAWPEVLVEQRRGDNGKNGAHGEYGLRGRDGNDMYWCDKLSDSKELAEYFTSYKKLKMSFTTSLFIMDDDIEVPHLYNTWSLSNTLAVFEEYTPDRSPDIPPVMRYADRVKARAQVTVQSAASLTENSQVKGLSTSHTPKADKTGNITRMSSTTEEKIYVVLERSLRTDDDDGSFESAEEEPPTDPWGSGLRWSIKSGFLEPTIESFDKDFERAQRAIIEQNTNNLREISKCSRSSDAEYVSIVLERDSVIQGFMEVVRTIVKNDGSTLVRLINSMIAADSEPACTMKWRTVVHLVCSLTSIIPSCDWRLLALLIKNSPSNGVVNSLIYLRLVLSTRSIDLMPSSSNDESTSLWEELQALQSTEAKALLVRKVDEAEHNRVQLNEDVLSKILILLRHADRNLQELSMKPITKWMEIADQQNSKLTEQNSFGPITYYLGVLTSAGIDTGHMRAALKRWKEKKWKNERLLGEIVHCIITKELIATTFFSDLNAKLNEPNCDEESLRAMLPSGKRCLNDLPDLVKEIEDSSGEASELRRGKTQMIVDALAEEPLTSDNAKQLAIFDDALKKITDKRLHVVQKIAIMSALESPTHLLQQVSTGEGKSYIIAAIAAIRCLRDENANIDIITSSSALAERDANQLRALYNELELSVDHICHESRDGRAMAYKARIIYGDLASFQRDYLVHTFYGKTIRGTRQLEESCVIVDEVDSMTLDSGNHVLYLSHKVASLKLLDSLFLFIQREVHEFIDGEPRSTEDIRVRVLRDIFGRLSKTDLKTIDAEHADSVFQSMLDSRIIDDEGFLLVKSPENLTKLKDQLISLGGFSSHSIMLDALRMEIARHKEISLPFHLKDFVRLHISTFIDNCKRARVMRPNVDYVIDSSRSSAHSECEEILTIVDVDTGVDLTSTQWAQGLHQFLQMKHACRITPMSLKAFFISNVSFLRKYKRLDGLSGTLGSAEESRILADLYSVDLIRIPTHKPRRMAEYVPVLSEKPSDWIDDLYRVISKEVKASRSVLVICETINQLQELHNGLLERNRESRGASEPMDNAVDKITVYKRQHEPFEYQERGLEAGQIIISTNLAGRGTDILLSEDLESNGGLHVVIAFVPRNKRIEEQAMGRAARGGAPGSGQIIALVRRKSDEIAPSSHDFKTHRDEKEKQRICELRHNFDFRVDIEEFALERFREGINKQQLRENAGNERLPVVEDVIYRARLDEWTLWLDAKDNEIEQCAKESDDAKRRNQKTRIIESVDDFLAFHDVKKEGGLFVVPKWIRAGEWLLRIGIIQMHHAGGQAPAEQTFNRVIEEGGAFAPFALYYSGCMAMQNLEEMRKTELSLRLETPSKFKQDADRAIRQFAMARVGIMELLERRSKEVREIQQRTGSSSSACGLQLQLNELRDAVGYIIANIDWLIGEPITAESFRQLTSSKQHQRNLFEALKKIDVITPPLIGDNTDEFISHHHEIIHRKFNIGRSELMRALSSAHSFKSPCSRVMSGGEAAIGLHLPLPTRMNFWHEMKAIGAFRDIAHVYYVREEGRESVKTKISVPPMVLDGETARFSILYSNRTVSESTLYSKSDIDVLIASDASIAATMQSLIDVGSIELDLLARIDINHVQERHLLHFDGFTSDQLKDHFNFDEATCNWILDHLIRHGVIEQQRMERVKLADDWMEKALQFESLTQWLLLDDDALDELAILENAFTISPVNILQTLQQLRSMTDEEGASIADGLFNTLLREGVLRRQELVVYRKIGSLNCSKLPAALADPVIDFLSHHFAYTFAREVLWSACTADSEKTITTKKVMLPADAHQELFEELCRLEIIAPPRITSRDHLELIDYADFPLYDAQELEQFIVTRRVKLRDEITMFNLVSFVEFLAERKIVANGEMDDLIDLGMAAGITLKKLTTVQKMGGVVTQCFRFLIDNRKMLMKCITFAIGVALTTNGLEAMEGINTDRMREQAFAAVAAAGAHYQQFEMNAPREVTQALHRVASSAVGAIEGVQRTIGQSLSFIGSMIMGSVTLTAKAFVHGIDWLDQAVVARVMGKGIHQCMSYLFEKCRALFGSSEYYHQCRMATCNIATHPTNKTPKDEYRIIRMFNAIGDVADVQNKQVDAREQALVDQTSSVARNLKEEFLHRLFFPSSAVISFDGLAEYLSDIDNMRWFESELTLCLRWAAMGALSKLTETGQVDEIDSRGIKFAAVTSAYLELWIDCFGECNQRTTMDTQHEADDRLEDIIGAVVEAKIAEFFTTPLKKFIECIFSEHFECGVSKGHQVLLDADIAKTARHLRRGSRNTWLDSLQRIQLVTTVHTAIAHLFQEMHDAIEGKLACRSIDGLTRLCLSHRLPMPFDPCFSIISEVSDHFKKLSSEEIQGDMKFLSHPKRYILLSKAEYSQWKTMFRPEECLFLFETISDHGINVKSVESLRDSLIKALSPEPSRDDLAEDYESASSSNHSVQTEPFEETFSMP